MGRLKPWIPTRRELPGIALATALGLVALALGSVLGQHTDLVSDVVIAIALGAIVLNSPIGGWLGLGEPTDRDVDVYERGLRFTGKWVLRLAIILMGLKIRTDLFRAEQLWMVGSILLFVLPTAFFLTHIAARALGIRRELADLLGIGSMICGASAINALSPVIYARRRDQGLAITAVFLFSIVALVLFRPIAGAVGLSDEFGALWAGLAVNDLSSSVAVGAQFGESGNVIAAAAKSMRIMLLGPALICFSFLRPARREAPAGDATSPSVTANFPMFILGYFALFGVRMVGDEMLAPHAAWTATLSAATVSVKVLLLAVCAGIGLQIRVATLIQVGGKAVAVGAAASTGVAGLSLLMLVGFSRGEPALAVAVAAGATALSFAVYRMTAAGGGLYRPILRRLAEGAPLSMREAGSLLDYYDSTDQLDVDRAEGILQQLHPAIGELQPLRTAAGFDSISYRRLIYWQSDRGNGSLVGILWPPGAEAHIHSHGRDGAGKTIEGRIESTHFAEREDEAALEVTSRAAVHAGDVLRMHADAEIHSVRNAWDRDAIGIHFYGPKQEGAGRRFRPIEQVGALEIGQRVPVAVSEDRLPSRVRPEADREG